MSDSLFTKPIELFYSYSHRDRRLQEKLETHLALLKREGAIDGWHDRKISAGQEWANYIDEHLNSAQIILLLISADFLASDYCFDVELKRAMERHKAGEARVIPIILRPCDWHSAPFGKLQALPQDARPISTWSHPDDAFLSVVQGIRNAIKDEFLSKLTAKSSIVPPATHKSENSLRVLICEDEGVTVMQIRKALIRGGYEIVGEAVEGRKAIEMALELKPDLILMDYNMPGPIDGFDATREILQYQPIPIIILSAYSDDNYVDNALDAGACAYLVKPITDEQLLPGIKLAIARFHTLQTAIEEANDLKEALEIRREIENAIGILMERRGLRESDAFHAILKMSRDKCQTMKQTANDIIKASEIL